MKRILLLAALLAASAAAAQLPAEIRLDKQALRPRYREWAQPPGGVAVTQNPPALLWPASGDSKHARYRVRLSQDSTFAGVAASEPFEWRLTPATSRSPRVAGTGQWSVAEPGAPERWSEIHAFTVDASARRFATRRVPELVRRVAAMPHHRLYVSRDGVGCVPHPGAAKPRSPGERCGRPRQTRHGARARSPDASARYDGDDAFREEIAHQLHVPQIRRGGHATRRRFLDGLPAHGREPSCDAAVRHALHAAALPSTATPRRRISTARPSCTDWPWDTTRRATA